MRYRACSGGPSGAPALMISNISSIVLHSSTSYHFWGRVLLSSTPRVLLDSLRSSPGTLGCRPGTRNQCCPWSIHLPVFYQVCSTYSPSHHRILRSRDRVADRPRLEVVKPVFCPLPNPGDVDQEVGVGRHLLQPRQVVDEYFLVHLSLQCQL